MEPAGRPVLAVAATPPAGLPPGLSAESTGFDVRLVSSAAALAREAADAEIVFVWDARAGRLREFWGFSRKLRWIATATAGVDWLLFPQLISSDVIVTNSAGIFDAAMAEYALALVAAVCADLHTTIRLQAGREWRHRETTRLAGRRALVVGAGGIGRAIGRVLGSAGVVTQCVGRRSRDDPELGRVAGVAELPGLLPEADFVILALPLTAETAGILGAQQLALMRPGSWLVNLGRGALVDEPALIGALCRDIIGGAALDVFADEPLPPQSPLWALPNVIVSPHMSGDSRGWERAVTDLFLAQVARYRSGQPLRNVVDKALGYSPLPPAPEG